MRILFFDLETTGLSKEINQPIEICAIVYNTDTESIEEEYDSFVKPDTPIPYQITQLTSITNAMVRNAPIESMALYDFMQWAMNQDCDQVSGHNIDRFDIPFIKRRCEKYKIEYTLPPVSTDTLALARQAYKDGLLEGYNYTTEKGNLSFKQEYLMDFFHFGVQEHRALTDVQYCIMVYKKLMELTESIDYGF